MKNIIVLFSVVIIQLFSINQISYAQGTKPCMDSTNVFEQLKCLTDRAVELNNVAVCDQSNHVGVKYQCYAIYAEKVGNWKTCNHIPTENKELSDLKSICISDVAKKNMKEELCEKVDVLSFKDGCYMKIAESTGNKKLCEKISDPNVKSFCTGEPVYIK